MAMEMVVFSRPSKTQYELSQVIEYFDKIFGIQLIELNSKSNSRRCIKLNEFQFLNPIMKNYDEKIVLNCCLVKLSLSYLLVKRFTILISGK